MTTTISSASPLARTGISPVICPRGSTDPNLLGSVWNRLHITRSCMQLQAETFLETLGSNGRPAHGAVTGGQLYNFPAA